MTSYRFRFCKDFDVPAENRGDAELLLKKLCSDMPSVQLQKEVDRGAVSYIGQAEVRDIDEEDRERAAPLIDDRSGLVLMSCQYRGENFTGIFKRKDLGENKIALTPLALLLREDKLDNLKDLEGDSPIIIEKELHNEE